MMDQRQGGDRRRAPRGGRRIDDLATHEAAWIAVEDFATHLDVSLRQVWKWHHAGLLAIVRLPGRCNRIERLEAVRFVSAYRKTA
jgi:hypothetical protein